MADPDLLADLVDTHGRFEKAIRGLDFEAAQVAWKRLDVLLDRVSRQALAAVVKTPAA